jgi:hypothetical protein
VIGSDLNLLPETSGEYFWHMFCEQAAGTRDQHGYERNAVENSVNVLSLQMLYEFSPAVGTNCEGKHFT